MPEPDLPPLPRPAADLDTAPYWQAAQRGELRIQRCSACGAFRFPPKPVCPACGSFSHEWVRSSGRGRVYSWTVVHHAVHPSVREGIPYVVVLVELEEGVRMVSNLTGCDPADITPDLPVEVYFERRAADLALPMVRPARRG